MDTRFSEVITEPLYDYQQFVGDSVMEFFKVPVGLDGKTRFDTNLMIGNALPTAVSFVVREIEVSYFAQSEAEYSAAGKLGRLQLHVLSKSYLDAAPLGRFMRPWRKIRLPFEPMTEVSEVPWIHGPFVLEQPFTLLPAQMFGVVISWEQRPADARMGVVFHGFRSRPVC